MGDDGAGRPAAHAIAPPADPSHGDLSRPRLATAPSEGPPATPDGPVATDWAMATAPTLLLKPVEGADDAASASRIPAVPPMNDDAVSTSRIPTSPPTAGPAEQPWFKAGTTMPPPSMRPRGESIAPAPLRRPPNPRVLKTVLGVIAGCLFIVALAGVKLAYQKLHTPAAAPIDETSAPKEVALAQPTKAQPAEPPAPAEPLPAAQRPSAVAPAATALADDAPRAAPVRATAAPRTTTKTTTHRAPPPKKPVRGTR